MRQSKKAWTPMQKAQRVPHTAEKEALLRTRGADDALLEELRQSEMWVNDRYVVVVTRWDNGTVQQLSIRRQDRKAVHDWRHFQRIKSEIAGREVEAFEIYPAESRLMDTANQYYLFCLPPGRQIPVGFTGFRNVTDTDQALAGSVQRPLDDDWKDNT